ncbi:MAG: hypothetical protein AB1445_09730 [Bacillota bacterium]
MIRLRSSFRASSWPSLLVLVVLLATFSTPAEGPVYASYQSPVLAAAGASTKPG